LAQQASQSGIWDWDLASQNNFVSPEFRELYGMAPDMLVNLDAWLKTLHPLDRGRALAAVDRLRSGNTEFDLEFRILHPQRHERWLFAKGKASRDASGRINRFTGIMVDVTARKLAEQALRDSEERFRQLAENVNVGFWIMEFPGRSLVYASPGFQHLWGLCPEAMQKDPDPWNRHIHPDDRAAVERDFAAFLQGTAGFDVEYRIILAKDRVRWVHDRAGISLRDENGGVRRVLGIAEDITGSKEADAALREADRRKDEFIAMLAHELRNPLAAISNTVQILKLKESSADSQIGRARDLIERQLNYLVRLVDDLLDVSRITQGKVTLHHERVDLRDVVKIALETSQPHIQAGNHALSITQPETPLYVNGDLTRLGQVLSNLLHNAAKYTPHGGRIQLQVTKEDGSAILRVSDNGIGIPQDMLSAIFDMFMQVDISRERARGGLGIGLTLVKRLLELHGGTVEASSDGINQGALFTVKLPLLPAEADKDGAEPSASTPKQRKGRRILVIDDNVDAADSLALTLELLQHDVRVAYDGPSALKVADDFIPELVLLDIGMPGMNGYEVAQKLRTMRSCQGALVVAQTGWGQKEERERSAAAGFDRHLIKPVDLPTLQTIIAGLPPR
jgi:two-component system CheB/CheR fusion protein